VSGYAGHDPQGETVMKALSKFVYFWVYKTC